MLFKKRKKLLSLLAALAMTLSISSVAFAAGFNTISGDGVFREYTVDDIELPPILTNNRYEAQVEATINRDKMLFNLDIDFMSGNNPIIRHLSISNATLTLNSSASDPSTLGAWEYNIFYNENDPKSTIIFAKIIATISPNEGPQEFVIAVVDNATVEPLVRKDGILIFSPDDLIDPLLTLLAGKSTIQLSRQNAQGGQNQQ